MNEEELKKEAKEKYNERLKQNGFKIEYNDETYNDGYLDSAIPREKRIAELEAQIEKMKCCSNCDFIFRDGNCYYDKECKNKDHWKIRR